MQEANGRCDHRNARSPQDRDNPEEMNVVGKRGAYRGHEPTHKLSKGFAHGPIDRRWAELGFQ